MTPQESELLDAALMSVRRSPLPLSDVGEHRIDTFEPAGRLG
jgi:hypothetical protein